MILTFAGELTKMINAGLGRESAAPDTSVAVGRYSEYVEVSDAAVATFDTNAALPLRALTVDIEPIQEGTGDPSPENVRPITGRSAVTVTRAGKNLLDPADAEIGRAWNGASNTARARLVVSIMPNTDYVLSMNGTNSLDGIYKTLSAVMPPTDIGPLTTPFNFNSGNNKYLVLGFSKANIAQSDIDALKLQLELGTSATAYEAPNIQNVTIPLGQTVYGGTVDAVSGVMTVDRAMVTLTWGEGYAVADLGDITRKGFALTDAVDMNNRAKAICDVAPFDSGSWAVAKVHFDVGGTGTQAFVWMPTDTENNQAITICYPIATPLTIQLSAQQLTTLLGVNNVWSDGGNVSLTYTKYNYTEGY